MRRFLSTLLASLIVAPAAFAAAHSTGDGVFELNAVYGTVQIGTTSQPARGVLWGQMDKGEMRVLDPISGDGQILVSGYESKYPITNADGLKVTVYSGRDLHFRVTGGRYKLWFKGQGLDLTAVGAGVAYLDGDENAVDAGDYAVNSGDWVAMPTFQKRIPFGDVSTLSP
jgi:hypothetical protein